jgi:transaldolase
VADADARSNVASDVPGSGGISEKIYQALVVEDIRWAADVLRSVYNHTNGDGGFVSLEVSPHLAHDTEGTIEEARRLWTAVNRPNLFIKVPATRAGVPAIRQLISEGININVTLLFSVPRYKEVAQAYIAGLARRAEVGHPIDMIHSVASFFLSRIDVLVDKQLEAAMKEDSSNTPLAQELKGQVAIASAKVAYQIYQEIFNEGQFLALRTRGARVQRLLWASTGAKNPDYSDVKYVEALIGPQTINTMPLETLEAYRDHGQPELRLADAPNLPTLSVGTQAASTSEKGISGAYETLSNLSRLGINLAQVSQQLEAEGIQKFVEPYDKLMAALEQKYEQYRVTEISRVPDR